MLTCLVCGKELKGKQIKYCSIKCGDHNFYLKHKQKIHKYYLKYKKEYIERAMKWQRKNSGRRKQTAHSNYLKNKQKYIERARRWEKQNPKRKKEIKKKACDKFRKNKPERFKELMKRSYQRNKEKWKERDFIRKHRNKIIKIIGKKCKICGKPMEEIHHKIYDNLPRARNHNPTKKEFDRLLVEYCKFLIPLCKKHHLELNRNI